LINNGSGDFEFKALPLEAQFSSVNGIVIEDFNSDGNLDLALAGNLFAAEVETPRNDAGIGLFLKGDGKNNFKAILYRQSGFYANGDVKDLEVVNSKNSKVDADCK